MSCKSCTFKYFNFFGGGHVDYESYDFNDFERKKQTKRTTIVDLGKYFSEVKVLTLCGLEKSHNEIKLVYAMVFF